jgi:hypothetical protein
MCLCPFVFQAVCKHFESIAIDVREVVDLVVRESGFRSLTARIGQKLLARCRVKVNEGQKTLQA